MCVLYYFVYVCLSLCFAKGDASDSDGAKKKKRKFRLEIHDQQTFIDSSDEVGLFVCLFVSLLVWKGSLSISVLIVFKANA